MSDEAWAGRIEAKMRLAGVGEPTIRWFTGAAERVRSGERGLVPEAEIEPVMGLIRMADLPGGEEGLGEWLGQLALVKLNGGLGTSMGLDRAKSLMMVKGGATFLDFIVRQVMHLRGGRRGPPAFYLMNSFSTRADTLAALARYGELVEGDEPLDFLQNKVPKLDAASYEPASWPAEPELEWCPPGHGDIYASMLGTGILARMRARGLRVLFVSNADNLGATVDVRLLRYFLESGLSFMMEVAERTSADRKGGHLARRRGTGRLLLRESAQVPSEEEESFQDIGRYGYFNTNNLWVRLDHLEEELRLQGGLFALPLIVNTKTLDPQDSGSPRVVQLESAMGAAIECFSRSGAVVVGRERFAPVKTTADLLAVRSDAYRVTADHRVVLDERRGGRPPEVSLDPEWYRVIRRFEELFPAGAPSLVDCDSLKVTGPVRFQRDVVLQGCVCLRNGSGRAVELPPGLYRDTERNW
jgi:UDP-N-acetylglucosamine pyrophosphorylase